MENRIISGKIRIVFVSNYYNHHQVALSEALCAVTEGNYCFIETDVMSEERKKLGYGMKQYPSFVIQSCEFVQRRTEIQKMIDDADLVILGSAPDGLLNNRLSQGKLTFRYSERMFKNLPGVANPPTYCEELLAVRPPQERVHALRQRLYGCGLRKGTYIRWKDLSVGLLPRGQGAGLGRTLCP